MVQSECRIFQIAHSEEKQGFKRIGEAWNISRYWNRRWTNQYKSEFCSFLIHEFSFTFHISLLRKHILHLPSRSHNSVFPTRKKWFLIAEKFGKNGMVESELCWEHDFLNSKRFCQNCYLSSPVFEVHIYVGWNLHSRFKIPVKLNLLTSPCLNSLILLLNLCWWYWIVEY